MNKKVLAAAVSISYGESEDASQAVVTAAGAVLAAAGLPGDGSGWKDKGFQIGFNHNNPKAKVDLYAGINGNQLDAPTGLGDFDDIYTFVIGTKLKFD
jgi:hypothetical protein